DGSGAPAADWGSELDESLAPRLPDRVGTIGRAKLSKDRAQMQLHRPVADAESGGDGLVRQAIRQAPQHLELTRSQRIEELLFVVGCGRRDQIAIDGLYSSRFGRGPHLGDNFDVVGQQRAQARSSRRRTDQDYS